MALSVPRSSRLLAVLLVTTNWIAISMRNAMEVGDLAQDGVNVTAPIGSLVPAAALGGRLEGFLVEGQCVAINVKCVQANFNGATVSEAQSECNDGDGEEWRLAVVIDIDSDTEKAGRLSIWSHRVMRHSFVTFAPGVGKSQMQQLFESQGTLDGQRFALVTQKSQVYKTQLGGSLSDEERVKANSLDTSKRLQSVRKLNVPEMRFPRVCSLLEARVEITK